MRGAPTPGGIGLPIELAASGGALIDGVIYVVIQITLGIISVREGRWMMFIIGLFIPLFWLIGALLARKRGDSRQPAPRLLAPTHA